LTRDVAFTERDLTRRILDDPQLLSRRGLPGDVGSRHVRPSSAEVVDMFGLMDDRHVQPIPVVDEGTLTERILLHWVGQVARE
jgi:hypothetical protein